MNKVFISKEVKAPFKFKRVYKKALDALVGFHTLDGRTEVNLIITDNDGIQKISNEYKKKNKPTDVLSFPAGYKELKPLIGYNMLGDIYISFEKVDEQSKKYGHSNKREWTYLFVHGLLHLIGYDHLTPEEEKEMNIEANKIMKLIKVGR